jgi:hypothetical protein
MSDEYVMFCLRRDFEKYSEVHMQAPHFNRENPPYRRILAWRTMKCLNEHASLISENDRMTLRNAAVLSEKVGKSRQKVSMYIYINTYGFIILL